MIEIFHPADEVFLKTGSELFHWHFDENKDWDKCLEYGNLIIPTLRYINLKMTYVNKWIKYPYERRYENLFI